MIGCCKDKSHQSGVQTSPSPRTAVRRPPAAGEPGVASSDKQTWFRCVMAAVRGLAAIVSSAAETNEAAGGGGRLEALLHVDSSIFRPSLLAAKV